MQLRNVLNGLGNFWRYRKAIYTDVWWDYSGILQMLEAMLRHRAAKFAAHGYHVGNDRAVKRMLVCAELCRRIADDSYVLDGHPFANGHDRRWAEWVREREDADNAMLFNILRRHLRRWWD
jgi:hypothetical protein